MEHTFSSTSRLLVLLKIALHLSSTSPSRGVGDAGATSELELGDDRRADDGGAEAKPLRTGLDAERPVAEAESEGMEKATRRG
jgi:hypothetical protein